MAVITTIEGLPVINAKKPLKLHVTPLDIKAARKHSPGNCAVAKACQREWKAKEVRVHLSRIYVRHNEQNWTRYFTPYAMRSEIIAYDRGGEFLPSVYTVTPPSPSHRVVGQQGSDKVKSRPGTDEKKKKKRKKYTVVVGVRVAAHR
jgi:hypothetical protein